MVRPTLSPEMEDQEGQDSMECSSICLNREVRSVDRSLRDDKI
jgi:hypothetical protein